MSRHTTFRYCLEPTSDQCEVLARYSGASRFAFNQCLRLVKSALSARKTDPGAKVPWTGFDLINLFNAWKRSEEAGRLFTISPEGSAEVSTTGLVWRDQINQQVFEEAAVDLGKGLAAWLSSRRGQRRGKKVGFPRFKKKTTAKPSFRLRNKLNSGRTPSIRLGDGGRLRSITLPGIGQVGVCSDTRRLRQMLAKNRASIRFATVSQHGGRWWVSLNVEAADLHADRHHPTPVHAAPAGWAGLDRGLSAFLVTARADGTEVIRIADAPKALAAGMRKQERLAKSLSRKKKGSHNRKEAVSQLGRHHRHVANIRRHFLHRVSNEVVKTHDRLVLEDLNVQGMLANRRLARAISDAGWTELSRLIKYKQAWRGGRVIEADRWYPSTRLCPRCSTVNTTMTLADRTFVCVCGHRADRDANAATNLARWAHNTTSSTPGPPKQRGRVNNARRRNGSDRRVCSAGETVPSDAGTAAQSTAD